MAQLNVDIYIKEKNGSREIRIPWLPTSIEFTSGGTTVATYDILDKGPVEVPTGSGLATISWQGIFPGVNRVNLSLLRGSRQEPSYFHNILEDWRKKGTALNVLVTGYPINKDVYLSNYDATAGGGFGDMEYTVEFKEDKDLTITTKKTTTSKDKSSSSKNTTKKTTTYTLKKSDTLWKVAKKFLGSGKKWKKIYTANKTIIEKTAKKHGKKSSNNGKYLYAGTKIKIPK